MTRAQSREDPLEFFVGNGRVLITKASRAPRFWGWLCFDCGMGEMYGKNIKAKDRAKKMGEDHSHHCPAKEKEIVSETEAMGMLGAHFGSEES